MSSSNRYIRPEIYRYILDTTLRSDPLLDELRRETAEMPMGMMQISPDQGQLMGLLTRACGARKALELGVFTGYSSISVARSLPPDGKLVACDVSEEYTAVARRYWERAGLSDRIDLRLAPALDTLDALIQDGESSTFDIAFIDADKGNYLRYYERCLLLLREGGLLLVDNALWGGRVADPSDTSEATNVMRELNSRAGTDDAVDACLLPVGDGLLLVRKR